MLDSGNVQGEGRIVAFKMNRRRGVEPPSWGTSMIKFALVALFAMSMATLTLAASALPVETAVTTELATAS
jgi:hypothetical protein